MKEVYEKYKHLDHLLSDPEWLPKNILGKVLQDIWQGVKDDQKMWAFFDSVSCLFAEGRELDHEELYQAIKKEWEKTLKP